MKYSKTMKTINKATKNSNSIGKLREMKNNGYENREAKSIKINESQINRTIERHESIEPTINKIIENSRSISQL